LVNIVERRVALEVSFDDADLAKTCRNEREMLRRYGAVRAKKLQLRLKTLRSAETLADMRSLPGRCHELHGDLAGTLSLDLDHPYRLLIRPADATRHGRDGGLDWSAVCAVVVVGIADTHD
jgi:plasmid maintenance system killer protein